MPRRNIVFVWLLLLSGLLGFLVSLYMHGIFSKTVPTMQVETIQVAHYPALFVKQLAGDKEAGRKIFKEFCASCHAKEPVIDVNAPKIGDQKAWQSRKKLGLENLLKITFSGVGAMPARGGCFECSDAQLRATVEYILKQSNTPTK